MPGRAGGGNVNKDFYTARMTWDGGTIEVSRLPSGRLRIGVAERRRLRGALEKQVEMNSAAARRIAEEITAACDAAESE